MSEAPKLIAELLDSVSTKLDADAARRSLDFLDHNERGLAYDELVFQMRAGEWHPSDAQVDLLKRIASAMGGVYSNLSTD